jgi:hypothetical protein
MEKNEFQAINADILAFFCTHVSRNKFVEILIFLVYCAKEIKIKENGSVLLMPFTKENGYTAYVS